jgi:ferrous iron transport protein B
MWERARLFLQRAGTVILGISILLWFLSTYPRQPEILKDFAARKAQTVQQWNTSPTKDSAHETAHNLALAELDNLEAGEKLRHSFAGKLGHLIEPIIAPLGFDWKIGIGIIASFAAREVFVSTMSTVYNVGAGALASETNQTLTDTLKNEKRSDGTQIYSPLLGITLMVFYVFALQCVSTVAVVRRETNSWKWPIFQWVYMGALAWVLAFLTFQGGKLLGFQ